MASTRDNIVIRLPGNFPDSLKMKLKTSGKIEVIPVCQGEQTDVLWEMFTKIPVTQMHSINMSICIIFIERITLNEGRGKRIEKIISCVRDIRIQSPFVMFR